MFDNYFLLNGEMAKNLYNDVAKGAPIYDYHCHLSAKEIYEDKTFTNISKIFLEFDHYKWRAMRYAGIPERYITGEAEDFDKFKMWAKTCQRLIGSPLYHWTNMELSNFFGINETLKESNAERIYDYCNKKIMKEGLSPTKLIKNSNVKLICTTDDPVDNLEYHGLLALRTDLGFKVLPTFRPDKAINISKADFLIYLQLLENTASRKIVSYRDLIEVLKERIDYFCALGCRLSDHSLESMIYFSTNDEEASYIFKKRMSGQVISIEEAEKYKCYTLKILAEEYHKKSWAMQLHIGAMRNNNGEMFEKIGVDSGYDIMNDFNIATHLSKLLDEINSKHGLPKTMLYTLNPKDNIILSTLPHCFGEDGIKGKVQFGAAWWFNDHRSGIYQHLKAIASQGMLADFVGMLTDSRSFLSYVRHDYFRRILCSFIGELVDSGEFEKDEELLKEIIEDICYKNIKNYLRVEG